MFFLLVQAGALRKHLGCSARNPFIQMSQVWEFLCFIFLSQVSPGSEDGLRSAAAERRRRGAGARGPATERRGTRHPRRWP